MPSTPHSTVPRKLIQIAVTTTPEDPLYLFGLCNDGSLWLFMDGRWFEVPNVPQPDVQKSPPSSLLTFRQEQQLQRLDCPDRPPVDRI
jgi:hypothetical protein